MCGSTAVGLSMYLETKAWVLSVLVAPDPGPNPNEGINEEVEERVGKETRFLTRILL